MKILLAEDVRTTATLVKHVLTRAGHTVRIVADGAAALDVLAQEFQDVLVTDWYMPGVDGLELVQRVRAGKQPTPAIVMLTANSSTESRSQALLAGADEFLAKPARPDDIVAAVTRCIGRAHQAVPELTLPLRTPKLPATVHTRATFPGIVVASSTGGPDALRTFLQRMPAAVGGTILIAQHAPSFIMPSFLASLQRATDRPVHLGESGVIVQEGHVYVAPGDHHMMILPRAFTLVINQEPPENFVRPAADPLFRSAAAAFGSRLVAVVLTGMGRDGTQGCSEVRTSGGKVLVQEPGTAAAPSMPRTVIEAGLADQVVPLDLIGDATATVVRAIAARRMLG